MSVYKKANSPFYHYDFKIGGRRFHGSTQASNKKEAMTVERDLKAKAKADIERERATGNAPLTLDVACGRYFREVGRNHADQSGTYRSLETLIAFFGPEKRLDEITDADVAAAIAWRRSQHRFGKETHKDGRPMETVSNATINMTVTKRLRALLTRARRTWKYPLPLEPNWRDHILREPTERVRELRQSESDALEKAIREDYAPWMEFARLTAWRFGATIIRWEQVDWDAGMITNVGKGGRTVTTPITVEIKELLEPLIGHHPDWVFTFVARRTAKGFVKGVRYPIRYNGASIEWRRALKKSGVKNFRFHDHRHDIATKTLRQTRNLKLVSRILGHTNISTTMKYAHVLDDDVADALHLVAESRKNSRTKPQIDA